MDSTTTTTPSSPPPPKPNTTPQMDPHPTTQMVVMGRRVPPPCWAPDETTALIQAYRDKWYSLRRGNLRSHHWQEVADDVASRFPSSPKTSVQCRHKMEKLRKRHRGEKQRAAAFGGVRFKSNWTHFKHMEDMERGPCATAEEEEEGEDPDAFLKPLPGFYRNNNNVATVASAGNNNNRNVFYTPQSQMMMNGGNGYRVRVPERSSPPPGPPKFYDEFGVPKANFRSGVFGGSGQVSRNERGVGGGIGRKKGGFATREMVEAIRGLGDRFVRAEKMKMDMAREIEEMRMEMEMKRTAMILDSQQQLVEAFADAVFGGVSNKLNKMQTPDC